MPGLSSDLYKSCRETLLKCREFDSDAALRAVFVTAELRPFHDQLPTAANRNERVDACLASLTDMHLSDGRPVLPLFLQTLRSRYQDGDHRRDELEALADKVQKTLTPEEPISVDAKPGRSKKSIQIGKIRLPGCTVQNLVIFLSVIMVLSAAAIVIYTVTRSRLYPVKGKVCMTETGWDTNTIFLRRAEFSALGLPIGTKATVSVLGAGMEEDVTLSLDAGMEVCAVRLSKPLREALGVDADVEIKPQSQRPDRYFRIVETSPPANQASFASQGKVCEILGEQDKNTFYLRQKEFDAFGVPAGTSVSVTALDTDRTISVTLGLDSEIEVCTMRLSHPLREALDWSGDTDIKQHSNRPDRSFSITFPSVE